MDVNSVQNTTMTGPAGGQTVTVSRLAEHRELIQAVQRVNAAEMVGDQNELTFLLDRETQRPMFRIVNRKTGEVILQVPQEYVLRLVAEAKESEKSE